MNTEAIKAKVKKLLGNPVVNEAAGVLELAQGNYKLTPGGLYVPADYTGGAQAAKKVMFPFMGAADLEYPKLEPVKEVNKELSKPLSLQEMHQAILNQQQMAPIHPDKPLVYPGKVSFANDLYSSLDFDADARRTQVLEAMCAALLLGKDDTTYTINRESLEDASRLFNVRVTYYPQDENYTISLD